MNILETEIKRCIDTVSEITAAYKLQHIGADDNERSIDNLIATCESYLNKEIGIVELEIPKEESPAVSMSKCNKVKFISPVSVKVKSVFRKEEFGWAFPV